MRKESVTVLLLSILATPVKSRYVVVLIGVVVSMAVCVGGKLKAKTWKYQTGVSETYCWISQSSVLGVRGSLLCTKWELCEFCGVYCCCKAVPRQVRSPNFCPICHFCNSSGCQYT